MDSPMLALLHHMEITKNTINKSLEEQCELLRCCEDSGIIGVQPNMEVMLMMDICNGIDNVIERISSYY